MSESELEEDDDAAVIPLFMKKSSVKLNLYKRNYAAFCIHDRLSIDHILNLEWPHICQLLVIATENGVNEDIEVYTAKLIELQQRQWLQALSLMTKSRQEIE